MGVAGGPRSVSELEKEKKGRKADFCHPGISTAFSFLGKGFSVHFLLARSCFVGGRENVPGTLLPGACLRKPVGQRLCIGLAAILDPAIL